MQKKLIAFLVSVPVYGGVITTKTFDYKNQAGDVQAMVTVTVLDNYRGDPTRQDWIYNINNLSFTAQPGDIAFPVIGLGWFGGPTFVNVMESTIASVVGHPVNGNQHLIDNVSTSFCSLGCEFPGSFVLPSNSIDGMFPGQSASVEFSYLTIPNLFTINSVPDDAFLGIIDRSIGVFMPALTGAPIIPEPTAVPEPETMLLAAAGLVIASHRRRRP